VTQAVSNVNTIIGPAILGKCPLDQKALDTLMVQELDGTQNEWGWCKTKLGANAILAVSLAICKAGAAAAGVPLYRHLAALSGRGDQPKLVLPVPSFNIINGGSHAGNKLAMQEFMIMPTGASNFSQAMQMGAEVYQVLKSVISRRYGLDATNVGDEGGFAPNIQENLEGLDLIVEAIDEAGYTGKIEIAMDVAASEFWLKDSGDYDLDFKTEQNDGSSVLTGSGLTQLYSDILAQYPVASIEDPFDQDDWTTYTRMTKQMGGADGCQIVGDDLLVTNPIRVQKAIDEQSCNALLLKVNQIGSVTESIEAVTMAQRAGWGVMTSHRRYVPSVN
jgi:enolase